MPRALAPCSSQGQAVSGPSVKRWKAHRNPAGTMLGFFSVELSSGLIVNGFRLMIGPKGKRWIAPPSVRRAELVDGKAVWDDTVEYRTAGIRDKFNRLVIDLLRRQLPECFAGEP